MGTSNITDKIVVISSTRWTRCSVPLFVVVGFSRLHVRSTLNLKPLDAVTVSRFALIAGEDARAPSISLSLSAILLFGQGLNFS